MKKVLPLGLALATSLAVGPVSASDMYLDLTAFGGNIYDFGAIFPFNAPPFNTVGIGDANAATGIFNEFGFNQTLATSIYDLSDGSVLGSFYDTNVLGNNVTPNTLDYANVPASGTALDGFTAVSLVLPVCGAQCDLNALSPLTPPLTGADSEGFLTTWDLQTEFTFFGTLTASGPIYTGGTFDVYFRDLLNAGANSGLALSGTLTGSNLQAANLNLFFDLTFSAPNFLWIDNGSGFVSASQAIADGNTPTLTLDTNIDPPIPTADQLLLVVDAGFNPNAIRQARLDGSITSQVPEPATLALVGLAVLGAGAGARRGRKVKG